MKTTIQNINPIRRFTAAKAADARVSREEFEALEQKVDSLMDEVDAILSPENLTEAVAAAVRPLMDELNAKRGNDTTLANRRRANGRFRLPSDDDDQPARTTSKGKFTPPTGGTRKPLALPADAYKLPEGD